jgi:hypothetical protein
VAAAGLRQRELAEALERVREDGAPGRVSLLAQAIDRLRSRSRWTVHGVVDDAAMTAAIIDPPETGALFAADAHAIGELMDRCARCGGWALLAAGYSDGVGLLLLRRVTEQARRRLRLRR